MRILVVGGTGPIGAYCAIHLAAEGSDVTVSSRNPPAADSGVGDLDWLQGDYLAGSYSTAQLAPFDAIVFAAGSDIRHVPAGQDPDEHYLNANAGQVPGFAALARDAGVKVFIHIGSFYPQVAPDLIETDAYVRSRYLADQGVCALSDKRFRALSLNAPFVVGCPSGMANAMFMAYLGYARGFMPHILPFGPAGGSNFMSVRSLAEAVSGALKNGVGGTSYLLGDENLTFAEFFGLFFNAAGNEAELPAMDKEHPLLPDSAIITGRGSVVSYQPDPAECSALGYRRDDVRSTVDALVADIDSNLGTVEPVSLSVNAGPDPDLMRLASLYSRAVDANDAEIMSQILTDDVIIEGPGFRNTGKAEAEAIPAMLRQMFRKTNHAVYQQLCDVGEDTAVAETYCTANHFLFPDSQLSEDRLLTWEIRYQDRFARVAGEWRFKRRSLIVDCMEVRPVARSL